MVNPEEEKERGEEEERNPKEREVNK
jgi:hypothetical protein